MSSSRAMANKFTTSCSRSRDRRSRIQDESGQDVVIHPYSKRKAGTGCTGFFVSAEWLDLIFAVGAFHLLVTLLRFE